MSSIPGVFKGCRAMMATAKAGTAKPSAALATAKSKPSSASRTSAKTRSSGITKASPVSPALHKFLGAPESSRADAVKKIWEYIKLHNLQNPSNRKEIFCGTKLKTIFEGKDKVGFLEIGKLLSSHFVKTD